MYSVDRFFNMILSIELNENAKSLDAEEISQILLLISIYQNYVLLTRRNSFESLEEEHHLYKDLFRIGDREREKFKDWLSNVKKYIEVQNPVGCPSRSSDVLMVSHFIASLSFWLTNHFTSFFLFSFLWNPHQSFLINLLFIVYALHEHLVFIIPPK